jgi:hypothetical protein
MTFLKTRAPYYLANNQMGTELFVMSFHSNYSKSCKWSKQANIVIDSLWPSFAAQP